jgi:hypothetical protein
MSKASPEIRSLARAHTVAAIRALAKIMVQPKAPAAARVAAAVALLDRGWGKPAQTILGDADAPLEHVIRWAQSAAEGTPDPSRAMPQPSGT